jgi:hypothetical protein
MTITRLPNRRALFECVGKAHGGTAAIGCPPETERRDDRKVGTGSCEEIGFWGELAWAHMSCVGVKVVVVGWLSHFLWHRGVIAVVAIGHDLFWLLSQRSFAPVRAPVVACGNRSFGSRLHIHHQALRHVREQLPVVAGHRTALAVSHHMRVRSVQEARPTKSLRSCCFSSWSRSTSRTAASSWLARCRAACRRAAACRSAVVSFSSSSPAAFRMRTWSRARSRCTSSSSLRRKVLPPALALISVPSSVTRSSVISPWLSMPSTCTNKSSKAALCSERKPDSVRGLITRRPHSQSKSRESRTPIGIFCGPKSASNH